MFMKQEQGNRGTLVGLQTPELILDDQCLHMVFYSIDIPLLFI